VGVDGCFGVFEPGRIVSPSYGVYRPAQDMFLGPFLDELCGPRAIATSTRRSTGITDSRLRLYPDAFLASHCSDHRSMTKRSVRFFTTPGERYGRFITLKKKLITLLEEQKRAIVRSAVTRGSIETRPQASGIEMVSEIPNIGRPRSSSAYSPGLLTAT